MTDGIDISIVVRCFNSAKTLPGLLAKLDLQPQDELIGVDSGSQDGTVDLLESRGARVIHAPPPFNYSKSLNLGFAAAQNPWVFVISSHALPLQTDLLLTLRRAVAAFPPDVVVGYGLNLIDRRRITDSQTSFHGRNDLSEYLGKCANSSAIYRLSAWNAQPFDESIRTAEDHVWLIKAVDSGYRFAWIPEARTLNANRYSLRYMYLKGYSDSRAGAEPAMGFKGLSLNFGSHTKRLVLYGMPFQTWIRMLAHGLGSFFGSRGKRDNQPW